MKGARFLRLRAKGCQSGMSLPGKMTDAPIIYSFSDDVFVFKIFIPRNRSDRVNSFKNILLELRATARKARIVSAPAALICPNSKRGKDPWSFSPLGSPFSFTTRPEKRQNAAHAITAGRKKRTQCNNAATKAAAQNAGRNARKKPDLCSSSV